MPSLGDAGAGPEDEFQDVLQDAFEVPVCGNSNVVLQVSVRDVFQDVLEFPVVFSAEVAMAGALEVVLEVVFEVVVDVEFEVVFEVTLQQAPPVVFETTTGFRVVAKVVCEVVLDVAFEAVLEVVSQQALPVVLETTTGFRFVETWFVLGLALTTAVQTSLEAFSGVLPNVTGKVTVLTGGAAVLDADDEGTTGSVAGVIDSQLPVRGCVYSS